MKILSKINIFVLLAVLLLIFSFGGCSRKASYYTEEEHIQRITERLKEAVKKNSTKLSSEYQVYPLYDKNEQLKYALVEFEPSGFFVVLICDEPTFCEACFASSKSMYVVSADWYGENDPWTPYIASENSPYLPSFVEGVESSKKGEVILDENGEIQIYDKSPYFIAGKMQEKKYLLETTDSGSEYIYAVKKDDKFVNLIDGLVLDVAAEYSYKEHATLTSRFINNWRFDL